MATAALGDFETKLAASENHKETLLAQVNNLKEEMEVLQREGAKKPRASLTGGGGSGRLGSGRFSSMMQAHVQMLEAKVEALEEENRTLRQRELMRKMFALGDQAMAHTPPRCARPAERHCSAPASWKRMMPSLQPEMTPWPTYSQHKACASVGSLAAGGAS